MITDPSYLNGHDLIVWDDDKKQWLDEIEFLNIKADGDKTIYEIKYPKNSKIYPYYKKLDLYSLLEEKNVKEYDIYIDGEIHPNCTSLRLFQDQNYEVIEGYSNRIISKNVKLSLSARSIALHHLDYFRDLIQEHANISSQTKRDPESLTSEEILFKQYDKMAGINSEGVLLKYLCGDTPLERENDLPYIFPFAWNRSQAQAVELALNHQISVIEGPPGTGKTQVILNLIANLLIRDCTIGICSNNNKAVENVITKLKDKNLGFFCAELGNSEIKKSFFNQSDPNESLQNYLSQDFSEQLEDHFSDRYRDIIALYQLEQKLSQDKNALNEFRIEKKHFDEYKNSVGFTNFDFKLPEKVTPQDFLQIKLILEQQKKTKVAWKYRRYLRKVCGFKYQKQDLFQLQLNLENQYYLLQEQILAKKVTVNENILKASDFTLLNKNYQLTSTVYFNHWLNDRFKSYQTSEEPPFTYESYFKNFDGFLDRYPVICSSLASLTSSINRRYLLDYIIIDEASQADLLSSIPVLNYARNVIIVGDEKQLPPIWKTDNSSTQEIIPANYGLNSDYQYDKHSLLTSMKSVFGSRVPVTLLREHYRCHPLIINFCNQFFYDNQLISMVPDDGKIPLEIIKVTGNTKTKYDKHGKLYNQGELETILDKIVQPEITESNDKIGIITPFKGQVKRITDRIEENGLLEKKKADITAATVHSFQGQEKDLIFLSFVLDSFQSPKNEEEISPLADFIRNDQILNVAVSRSVKKLVVVCSKGLYRSKNNSIANLIDYIEYYTKNTLEHEIHSAFEILFEANKEIFDKLMANKKYKKIASPAERLFANLLADKLKSINPAYRFTMHVNLRKLIDDFSGFTEEEQRYLRHPWTHVDFVIYDQRTKKIKLLIEVDGKSYHEGNAKQNEHDKIKDRAIKRNHPFLRLRTDEANEWSRVEAMLQPKKLEIKGSTTNNVIE